MSIYSVLAVSSLAGAVEFAWAAGENVAIPYIREISGMSLSITGMVYMINPAITMWLGLLLGHWSDTACDGCCRKYGRRKPFVLGIGACAVASMTLFAFCKEAAGGNGASSTTVGLVALATYGVADSCHDLLLSPSRSLMKEILPENQRVNGESWVTFMSMLGRLVSFLVGMPRSLFPFKPTETAHDRSMLCIAAAVMCLSVVAVVTTVSEDSAVRDDDDEAPTHPTPPPTTPRRRTIREKLESIPRRVWEIFAIQCLSYVAVCTWAFYWTEFLGDTTTFVFDLRLAYVASVLQCVVAVVVGYFITHINAFVGTNRVLYVGATVFHISMVFVGLCGGRSGIFAHLVVYATAAVSGFGYAVAANNAFVLVQSVVNSTLRKRRQRTVYDEGDRAIDATKSELAESLVCDVDKSDAEDELLELEAVAGWYYAVIASSLPVAQLIVGGLGGLVASQAPVHGGGEVPEKDAAFLYVCSGSFGLASLLGLLAWFGR